MTETFFVDTNLLLYRRDTQAAAKQEGAARWIDALWQTRKGRLSVQVLNEFFYNATQKLKPGLNAQEAYDEVEEFCAWDPQPLDVESFRRAWNLRRSYSLAFWDSLIVAAALQARCSHILSEDLQHGQNLDGIEVTDPFVVEPGEFFG